MRMPPNFTLHRQATRLSLIYHLQPLQDNATRWNSFYLAIGRALVIKERIDKFCKSWKPTEKTDKGLKDDKLSATHWQQLNRMHDCLKVFEVTTLNTEGHKHWFYDWYPSLD